MSVLLVLKIGQGLPFTTFRARTYLGPPRITGEEHGACIQRRRPLLIPGLRSCKGTALLAKSGSDLLLQIIFLRDLPVHFPRAQADPRQSPAIAQTRGSHGTSLSPSRAAQGLAGLRWQCVCRGPGAVLQKVPGSAPGVPLAHRLGDAGSWPGWAWPFRMTQLPISFLDS